MARPRPAGQPRRGLPVAVASRPGARPGPEGPVGSRTPRPPLPQWQSPTPSRRVRVATGSTSVTAAVTVLSGPAQPRPGGALPVPHWQTQAASGPVSNATPSRPLAGSPATHRAGLPLPASEAAAATGSRELERSTSSLAVRLGPRASDDLSACQCPPVPQWRAIQGPHAA
jgi:hypothetical protein